MAARRKKQATEEQPEVPEVDVPVVNVQEEPSAPASAPAAKRNALGEARKALGKVFKDGKQDFTKVDESTFRQAMAHIPTGSIVLNNLIGGKINKWGVMPCPGWPRGRIINLYGRESSGKTTLCLETSALVCAAGGTVCYLDWENAIDVSYAKSLGVPIEDAESFCLSQPVTFERGLAIIWTMARAGVDLIIVDSVGSGIPQAEQDRTIAEQGGQGQVGYAARKWSDFLPKLRNTISETNTCVIGISQLRSTISRGPGSGPSELPQGGKAWKYYADVAVDLRRIASEKGSVYNPLTHKMDDALIANVVQAEIKKCRVSASQARSATFTIVYGEGIDDLRSVIEIGAANGVIKKGGAWYNWERPDGTLVRGQGLKSFKAEVLKSTALQEELYHQVMQALGNQPESVPLATLTPEEELVGDVSFFTTPAAEDGVEEVETY